MLRRLPLLAFPLVALFLVSGPALAGPPAQATKPAPAKPEAEKPAAEKSPAGAKPASEAAKPLARIAVVGASLSAGFGLDPDADPLQMQESRMQLAHVIDASLALEHEPVFSRATMLFFTAPKSTAKKTLAEVRERGPSALVALDYLFWMAYGAGGDPARLQRVDEALALLEPFECPVLLGDLPDFNGAGANPMMLPKESIPSAELLKQANARVVAWAKDRKHVVLIPVADTFARIRADEGLEVRGNRFGPGARDTLMQPDRLHTTLAGTCATWIVALDAWMRADPALRPELFVLEIEALAEKARASSARPPDAAGKGHPKSRPKAGAGSQGG